MSGISNVVTQVAKKCSGDCSSREDRTLLVSLMHCLFEAQDSSLCQLVASELQRKLTLTSTRLNPADCYYLSYFLTFCNNFDVRLSQCSVDADYCKSLFRSGEVYKFRSLDLYSNNIGNKGAVALAAAMKIATNLRELDLRGNSIGDEGAKALAAAMETAANLQKLHLDSNSISDEGAIAVAAAVESATCLQELYLWENDIGEEGVDAIRAAAKKTGTEIFISFQRQ